MPKVTVVAPPPPLPPERKGLDDLLAGALEIAQSQIDMLVHTSRRLASQKIRIDKEDLEAYDKLCDVLLKFKRQEADQDFANLTDDQLKDMLQNLTEILQARGIPC